MCYKIHLGQLVKRSASYLGRKKMMVTPYWHHANQKMIWNLRVGLSLQDNHPLGMLNNGEASRGCYHRG
jgi:hypothetical protein